MSANNNAGVYLSQHACDSKGPHPFAAAAAAVLEAYAVSRWLRWPREHSWLATDHAAAAISVLVRWIHPFMLYMQYPSAVTAQEDPRRAAGRHLIMQQQQLPVLFCVSSSCLHVCLQYPNVVGDSSGDSGSAAGWHLVMQQLLLLSLCTGCTPSCCNCIISVPLETAQRT